MFFLSHSDSDIDHVTTSKHRVAMTDELTYSTPFKQHHRRIPRIPVFKEAQARLHQLLSTGIFQKSKSIFSNNVVIVRKRNGDLRMCVDKRHLNSITKRTLMPTTN